MKDDSKYDFIDANEIYGLTEDVVSNMQETYDLMRDFMKMFDQFIINLCDWSMYLPQDIEQELEALNAAELNILKNIAEKQEDKMPEFIEGEMVKLSMSEFSEDDKFRGDSNRKCVDVTIRCFVDKNENLFLPAIEIDQNTAMFIRPIVRLIPIKRYSR